MKNHILKYQLRVSTWKEAIDYTLRLFAGYSGITLCPASGNEEHLLSIGFESADDIRLSTEAFAKLDKGEFHESRVFAGEALFKCNDGSPDYLGTAMYMLLALQEFCPGTNDEYNRYKYSESYQSKFSCAQQPLVNRYFEALHKQLSQKISLPAREKRKSVLYLTHDLDSFFGAGLQDGFSAFRKGKWGLAFRVLIHEILQRPEWLNLDKIMDIESEYDMRSTFFWLVNKGKYDGIRNADYSFSDLKVKAAFARVAKRGFRNGLHKSTAADPFSDEIKKLGVFPVANRNHFLRFRLPGLYRELEDAAIKLDSSFGFAEMYGFRNSFSLPLKPFDIERKRIMNVLSVPLLLMDTTFKGYLHVTPSVASKMMLDFIDTNRFDTVLTVLFHNNYFNDLKFEGYLKIYRAILSYARDNEIRSVGEDELIEMNKSLQ